MKRFRWDKKYLHWGVTAFLVIAAAILFYMIVTHLTWLGGTLRKFGRIISPFVWGLVIAYLLYPLMRIYQKGIWTPFWKLVLKKNPRAETLVPKLSRGFAVFLAMLSLLVVLMVVRRRFPPCGEKPNLIRKDRTVRKRQELLPCVWERDAERGLHMPQ